MGKEIDQLRNRKCKNCKYYKQNKGKDQNKHFGECNCKRFIYDDWGTDEHKEYNALIYWDYEGYSASFEVGENFGCIHYKEK